MTPLDDGVLKELSKRIKELEHSVNKLNITDTRVESIVNTRLENIEKDFEQLVRNRQEESNRLSDTMVNVDKEVSVQDEKLANIIFQMRKLEERVSKLESLDSKSNDRAKNIIINILMAVLGGIISYIFGLL